MVVSRRRGEKKRDGGLIANVLKRVGSESFHLCNVRAPLRVQESPLSVGSRWSGGLRGVPVYVYPNTFLCEGSPPHQPSVPIRDFFVPGHTRETPAIVSKEDLRNAF